jgi:hypothetical protein
MRAFAANEENFFRSARKWIGQRALLVAVVQSSRVPLDEFELISRGLASPRRSSLPLVFVRASRKHHAAHPRMAFGFDAVSSPTHHRPVRRTGLPHVRTDRTFLMHGIHRYHVAAGSFKTLAAAVTRQRGSSTRSKGAGPFTVFAPTDKAFREIPPAPSTPSAQGHSELKNLTAPSSRGRSSPRTL